jgi:hypothetical protein
MRKKMKKLALTRETLTSLTEGQSRIVPGGVSWGGITQCYEGTCNTSCGEGRTYCVEVCTF